MLITPALMSRIRELLVPMSKYSSIAQFKVTFPEHACTVAIRTAPDRGQITIILTDEDLKYKIPATLKQLEVDHG